MDHARHDNGHNVKTSSALSRRAPLILGIGAALAAMAMVVRRKTREAEQENPPLGRFLQINGIRLHYIDRGEGDPIVLLHGNGTMAQELDISGIVNRAAGTYRVIAFDRPGYGYSDRPRDTVWDPVAQAHLLHEALQKIGVDKAVVVGHSWGSMVAAAMAMEHPGFVKHLVLLSGYYYPTPRLDVPLFSAPAIPVVGDVLRHTISPVLGRLMWPAMVRKLFTPAKTSQRFTNAYPVWMTLRASQLRAATEEIALMIPSAYKLSERYHELKMPVTIMAGAGDLHVIPRLHSERLHEALPQSELILVPNVGHMIQHSAPAEVMKAIDTAAQDASDIHVLHPLEGTALRQAALQ